MRRCAGEGTTATLLGVIAVPVIGWFAADRSGATTLVVYWFETLAVCGFICARLALHRRWKPLRGHFDYRGPSEGRAPRPPRSSQVCVDRVCIQRSARTVPRRHPVVAQPQRGRIAGPDRLAQCGFRMPDGGRAVGSGFSGSISSACAVDVLAGRATGQRWTVLVIAVPDASIFGSGGGHQRPRCLLRAFVVLKSMAALSGVVPSTSCQRRSGVELHP